MINGKIVVNVTNNLAFDAQVSLFGSTSDPLASSVGAFTQYHWDIAYPFLNVANTPIMYIQYRNVGASTFDVMPFYTNLTYQGIWVGLNNLNFGIFWNAFPNFIPLIGYQVYTSNDKFEFGNITW
jgi:hypothetical protein